MCLSKALAYDFSRFLLRLLVSLAEHCIPLVYETQYYSEGQERDDEANNDKNPAGHHDFFGHLFNAPDKGNSRYKSCDGCTYSSGQGLAVP